MTRAWYVLLWGAFLVVLCLAVDAQANEEPTSASTPDSSSVAQFLPVLPDDILEATRKGQSKVPGVRPAGTLLSPPPRRRRLRHAGEPRQGESSHSAGPRPVNHRAWLSVNRTRLVHPVCKAGQVRRPAGRCWQARSSR